MVRSVVTTKDLPLITLAFTHSRNEIIIHPKIVSEYDQEIPQS